MGSIPGSGRSPGEENGNPVWYSCLGNPMDRGALQATVHGVAKTQMRLSMHRELIKGKGISGVYTAKEERGKGYAYNLVYTLSKKCLDEGSEYCVLYTDAENPISNHVYEKMGYIQRVECEELEFIKE